MMMEEGDDGPSRGAGLDVNVWCWLRELGLWNSMTGSDTWTCGIGPVWDSARRCCLFST